MYLRSSTRKKDGKVHTYWCLVRCVRRQGKVIQETVAQLGELDSAGRAQARLLAWQMTGCPEQRDLFEAEPSAETVPIRVDQVRIERSRRFGEVYLGWRLWCALGLEERLAELLVSENTGSTLSNCGSRASQELAVSETNATFFTPPNVDDEPTLPRTDSIGGPFVRELQLSLA